MTDVGGVHRPRVAGPVPPGWTYVRGSVILVAPSAEDSLAARVPEEEQNAWCRPPPPDPTPCGRIALRIGAQDWARARLRAAGLTIPEFSAGRRNGQRRGLVEACRKWPTIRDVAAASILLGIAFDRRPLPDSVAELVALEESAIVKLIVRRDSRKRKCPVDEGAPAPR